MRHGARCLTAGLAVPVGEVLGLVTPKRPATVFTAFLDQLEAHVPADSSSNSCPSPRVGSIGSNSGSGPWSAVCYRWTCTGDPLAA